MKRPNQEMPPKIENGQQYLPIISQAEQSLIALTFAATQSFLSFIYAIFCLLERGAGASQKKQQHETHTPGQADAQCSR